METKKFTLNRKALILTIIGLLTLGIIIGIICIWIFIGKCASDYSVTLNANWGFSLPSDSGYSEVYEQESEASIFGDGVRYHVFSIQDADPINEMFEWQATESETQSYSDYHTTTTSWLEEINVPIANYPDYEKCVYWYQKNYEDEMDELILLWNEEDGLLYIVESFF